MNYWLLLFKNKNEIYSFLSVIISLYVLIWSLNLRVEQECVYLEEIKTRKKFNWLIYDFKKVYKDKKE